MLLIRALKKVFLLGGGPLPASMGRSPWGDVLTWHLRHQGSEAGHLPANPPPELHSFLSWNVTSPPVPALPGQSPPTALSWMRRRGLPGAPVGLIYKAFRQRQIRVFDGSKVTRISKNHVLSPGHLLLIPKELQQQCEEHVASLSSHPSIVTPLTQLLPRPGASPSVRQSPLGPAPEAAAVPYYAGPGCDAPGLVNADRLPAHVLKRWILQVTRQAIFINKPAGVKVQGPGPSVDSLMQQALKMGPSDSPRLVHRVDRLVSGVLAIARDADAASWLAEGFVHKSKQEGVEEEEEEEEGDTSKVRVRRTYWALLAGHLEGRTEGKLRYPVLVDGRFRPATTRFKVRGTSTKGITLIELEPITGRKHQLRIHCAKVLGVPIIGDVKYGYQGIQPHRHLSEALPAAWWQAFSPRTADLAARVGSLKERRRMAAARYAQQTGRTARQGGEVPGDSDEDVDDGDDSEQGRQEWEEWEGDEGVGTAGDVPVFLHARSMVVHVPGQSPIRVRAPLPGYMADVVVAMGWALPPDSAPSEHYRAAQRLKHV